MSHHNKLKLCVQKYGINSDFMQEYYTLCAQCRYDELDTLLDVWLNNQITDNNEKINLSFEISKDSFELLKKINEKGYAEYRDIEWDTLDDFKKSEVFISGKRTEEWFLNRNFNGTGYLMKELLFYGLIEHDIDSWHLTYVLTNFGKEIIK